VPSARPLPSRQQSGFTLLELMVVVAIIALATAGVSLALRDSAATQLEQEGLRLSALLESARAQSRTSGVPLQWRSTGSGFEFLGAAPAAANARDALAGTRSWLSADTRAQITQPRGAPTLVLGPEPLIAAQRLVLMQGERRLTLGTDGLSPFAVVPEASTP
jgi:general secretion pathway protein H